MSRDSHLWGSTGYGYDDAGREALDKVYAYVFDAEDALVRHNFVSGTHALTVALFGCFYNSFIYIKKTQIYHLSK